MTVKTLLLSTLLLGLQAAAQEHHHHEASHEGPATARLELNKGKKWATDAALREGISAIRTSVVAELDAIHSGKYSAAQYEALAKTIDSHVGSIVSNCKLPAEADAQLHLVLADLVAGTSTMKGEGKRMKGVVQVIQALAAYGKHFDHPGFEPIEH